MDNSSTATMFFYFFIYALYYGGHIVAAILIVRAVRRNHRRRLSQNNTTPANNYSYIPINSRTVVNSSPITNNTQNGVHNPPVRTASNQQSNHVANQSTVSNSQSFGPVNYFANARHNQSDKWFQFEYKKENGVWLTYILRMPNLNGRDGNAHITHRYSGGGKYWICFDPQPKCLKDAQIISRVWADRELEYIATGVPFEKQNW